MVRRLRLPRGTVLVLAPHPDDECLGAGGLLALHARARVRAAVAFATDGEAGAPAALRGPRLAAVRRAEARAACRLLGAVPEFWGLPDGGLDRAVFLSLRVGEAVRRHRPALVLCPAEDDPHPDHRALARACRGLRRLTYEVTGPARPDLLLDVSAVIGRKLAALARHRSQERAHGWTAFARRRAEALALYVRGARHVEGFRYTDRRDA